MWPWYWCSCVSGSNLPNFTIGHNLYIYAKCLKRAPNLPQDRGTEKVRASVTIAHLWLNWFIMRNEILLPRVFRYNI